MSDPSTFFLSRAGSDRDVAQQIAQIIRDAGGETILQDEDFGHAAFMARMHDGMRSMDRMVVLLSKAYQESDYCLAECFHVLASDPLNKAERLVVLKIEDCDAVGMLRGIAYTTLLPVLGDPQALQRAVRTALGFDPPDDSFAPLQRRGRALRHPEIRSRPEFTGRGPELETLAQRLWGDSPTVAIRDATDAPVALRGIGGVGKTILAQQYAWEHRERYHGIWWIRAEHPTTLVDDLAALGRQFLPGLHEIDPEPAARATLDDIATGDTDKPWLLVYDNVENPALVRAWRPAENAHVVITTRRFGWQGEAEELPLDVFDLQAAVRFLAGEAPDDATREAARRLAEAVQCLPLALSHARAYCAVRGWTFDTYRERLGELLHAVPSGAAYSTSVFQTFTLGIEHAAAECAAAETLLGWLSCLAPDQVPLWMLAPSDLGADLDDAVAALVRVSLVTVERGASGERALSVHRVVQEVMRGRLGDRAAWRAVADAVTRAVQSTYDPGGSLDAAARNAAWMAHAQAVVAHAPEAGPPARHTLWVWLQLGDLHRIRSATELAHECYRAGLRIAQGLATADPGNAAWQRDLFASHSKLGDILAAQGKLQDALEQFQHGMDIMLRLATVDPRSAQWQRDLAVSYSKLGDILKAQGNLQDALQRFQRGMDIMLRLATADPRNAQWQRDLAVSHERRGDILKAQGNLQDALEQFQHGMDIMLRLATADPGNAAWQRDLAISHNKLGGILAAMGNLQDALEQFQHDMDITQRLATADPGNAAWQRDLAISHERLGDILKAQGNLQDALGHIQQRMDIMQRLATADPRNAAWQRDLFVSHSKLGDILTAQGNLQDALEQFQHGMDIMLRLATADPRNAAWQRDLAVSYNKLGDILTAQGNLQHALEQFQHGMDIRKRLATADPGNARWQRDLMVSCVKLHEATGEPAFIDQAILVATAMQERGILAPPDAWMVDDLRRRAETPAPVPPPPSASDPHPTALTSGPDVPEPVRALALEARASASGGDLPAARRHLREAWAVADAAGDEPARDWVDHVGRDLGILS